MDHGTVGHAPACTPSSEGMLAFSVEHGAKISGLGRTTLYEAMSAGELRYLKVGRRRLLTPEFLREFLERHQVEAA